MTTPPPYPAEPPLPDGEAAEIRCVYCGHRGAVRFEWREHWKVKALGTFALSGNSVKYSAHLMWWPWAVCGTELGGCGHESEGKPA